MHATSVALLYILTKLAHNCVYPAAPAPQYNSPVLESVVGTSDGNDTVRVVIHTTAGVQGTPMFKGVISGPGLEAVQAMKSSSGEPLIWNNLKPNTKYDVSVSVEGENNGALETYAITWPSGEFRV